jgi:hypothetical protein
MKQLAVSGLTSVVVVSSCLAFAACSASGSSFTASTGTGSPAGSGGAGTGSGSPTGTGTGGNPNITVGVGTGGATGTGGAGTAYAYAHTNTQLYQFDPNASTLTMTLVGTFDCIGTSTTTSSSSGGSGGPTTCADANGSTGCCIGNTEYYCASGSTTPTSKACTGSEVCTWNSTKSYYGCGTGPATGQNGGSPLACVTSGSSSSSSSGGATEDSSMTDIAVNSAGELWGVSEHNAYALTIEGSTVHCAKTIPLQSVPATFYGLSFVPKGVIDADAETLLAGDTQGDLWRIDTTTGALEQHGNFGVVPAADPQGHTYPSDAAVTGTTTTVGTPWQLSGDIVFLAGTSTTAAVGFATVRDCVGTTCSNTDTLLQIDTSKLGAAGTAVTGNVQLGLRGQVLKSATCADTTNTTYGKMFGIAAWNSTIYGFSHDSYIVEISNVDGSACAVGGMDTTESWSGAGVTTIAPIIPPPAPM